MVLGSPQKQVDRVSMGNFIADTELMAPDSEVGEKFFDPQCIGTNSESAGSCDIPRSLFLESYS